MSQFREFQDAVMADETLQSHFSELIESPNFDDASLIEFARQNGFSVVQEELDGVMERISDEALENVAGGIGSSEFGTVIDGRGNMQGDKIVTLSDVMKARHCAGVFAPINVT